MKDGVNGVALGVFIFFFLAVTVMGFLAARWRRADNEHSLDEWGLGGRSFGTWITWFLLGGDLYTAYTFVAVPAAIYAAGAAGFFAVPYTIVLYPIIFFFMSRMWSVSHRHGYVTAGDFIRGRYGSRGLSLAISITDSRVPCASEGSCRIAARTRKTPSTEMITPRDPTPKRLIFVTSGRSGGGSTLRSRLRSRCDLTAPTTSDTP